MTDNNFTIELAQQLYESEEKFPVDFEIGWQWLGYSRKDSAKRKLVAHFVEDVDYKIITFHKEVERSTGTARIEFEEIWLSANCLKEMGMMAGTEKGKEVRKYFLECERIAKEAIRKQSTLSPAQMLVAMAQQLAEQEQKMLEQQRKQQELDDRTHKIESRTDNLEQRIDSLNGASTGYTSIRRYCKENKIRLPLNIAKQAGKLAVKLCNARQIPIGSLKDEMFGAVGTYPHEIVEEAIAIAKA